MRKTMEEIKSARRHRADDIIKKRNLTRLKKLHKECQEEQPGSITTRKKPSYPATQALACDVINDLSTNGFSVIDDFLDETIMEKVLLEVKDLFEDTKFFPGKLSQMAHNKQGDVRGDMVTWLDVKRQDPNTGLRIAVKNMDRITNELNTSKLMRGCDIRSRSHVMVACYPGDGTGYKQHVDNPCQDGRKLTFILYLNRDYNQKRDGGVLRIYKKDCGLYFDIEPRVGRLVIFWSDSRTPHAVLPAYSERLAISLWYFDLVERSRTLVKTPMLRDRDLLRTCFQP